MNITGVKIDLMDFAEEKGEWGFGVLDLNKSRKMEQRRCQGIYAIIWNILQYQCKDK